MLGCPNNWKFYEGQCYLTLTKKLSKIDAENECKSLSNAGSGQLVALQTETLSIFLSIFAQRFIQGKFRAADIVYKTFFYETNIPVN